MPALIYSFDSTRREPLTDEPLDALRERFGGKAVGLIEMTRLGLPVPPGFAISVEAGRALMGPDAAFPDSLRDAVREGLAGVEAATGLRFGDPSAPLLVSVRSGAAASMPGMLDSVLNVGLDSTTRAGLAAQGGARFALDAHRRFLQMFGDVALGVSREVFEQLISATKTRLGSPSMTDAELDEDALAGLVQSFEATLGAKRADLFPGSPQSQLELAIASVYRSWNNVRARRYRALQGISDELGTACVVQAMVFGNRGSRSGAGVAFTRNPSTGERALYGEFLANAQGEDVVAGSRTPSSLTSATAVPGREDRSLERTDPEAFALVQSLADQLETHFRDVQDIEFTVEEGRVYLLQTRSAKRTAEASVRIAVALADEGRASRDEALLMVDANAIATLLRTRLPSPEELLARGVQPVATGLAASPGVAVGRIVFDPEAAERMAAEGQDVLLVRRDTTADDIVAMKGARGILTAAGGLTSHAAVLSRALGKCCVAGASTLHVDYAAGVLTARPRRGSDASPRTFRVGDTLTVDGSTGRVYEGALDVVAASTLPELDTLLAWADERRHMGVRANADTPRDVRAAQAFGAEGIGLCRTEHMFFADERLAALRCVVLASEESERERWVGRIEAMQRGDFEEIFHAMAGHPVTIRLLDLPLHEFMPRDDASLAAVAAGLSVPLREAKRRAGARAEVNPMIGHRGVRVGLTIPAIYRAQIRAVLSAAVAVARSGKGVFPELLVPLTAVGEEVRRVAEAVRAIAEEVFTEQGARVAYKVGTMIELPRACLVAGDMAQHVEFFSFGTNDLTQTAFGISRDDSAHFLPAYVDELGVLPQNPFRTLDIVGVGELIQLAITRGRAANPTLELGVCGAQGGEARSIQFFAEQGVDYVSCSLTRLVVARLATAQAALRLAGHPRGGALAG
ncbi:MAG: pyruvate, phosphate dikinase [Sandaracinaceae bacterium]|nr:pyruvate, phosphate dikinase [Sandaracinaceae bacterium]